MQTADAADGSTPANPDSPDASNGNADQGDSPSDQDSSDLSSGPRIVAMGDSITAGTTPGSGEPYPNTVAGIIGEPVAIEAIPGERAAVAAKRVGGVLAKYNEDVVTIMYGTNDILGGFPIATAVDGLRTLIQTTRADGATPFVATIPPMTGPVERNQPNVDALNGSIRSLASAEGAVLVDVAARFGDGRGLMLEDGFHPNSAGSELIASLFAGAVR